jgi:TolB-like protein
VGIAAAVFALAPPAQAGTNVAVFNFQMTSATPDWIWLEKFLSDQITTDFAQSGTLSVVARDKMQLVAQELRWAPEMATTDPERMKQIGGQLRIKYLVSGLCSVTEGGAA